MRRQQKSMLVWALISVFLVAVPVLPALTSAGDLEPPAGPDDPASAMFTIEDIYNYLDSCVAGTKRTGGFLEPTSSPAPTGHTLDDVHAKIAERCIDCAGTLSAGGRWCDNENGTVTDMSTGLVWLKDAGWGGVKVWADCDSWDDAHTRAAILRDGTAGAGLSDGSVAGDWRLPTKNELVGIIWEGDETVSSSNMHMFTSVMPWEYWTGTTYDPWTYEAYSMDMSERTLYSTEKEHALYVWPVRDGN